MGAGPSLYRVVISIWCQDSVPWLAGASSSLPHDRQHHRHTCEARDWPLASLGHVLPRSIEISSIGGGGGSSEARGDRIGSAARSDEKIEAATPPAPPSTSHPLPLLPPPPPAPQQNPMYAATQ